MNISQERPIGSIFVPTNSKRLVNCGFWLKAILAAFGVLSCHGALASPIYWSLFNIEGESSITADYVTYATLTDMLNDTNRTGVFFPNTFNAGRNIVGSGSDGTTYWSLFNIEGESSIGADYVTYATLTDMLNDTNRSGVFFPNTFNAGRNIVGSGSDGTTYWSLFNIEGESSIGADYVTYATLTDMLNDTNRSGVFFPNTFNAGRNIVGSGSDGTTYWSLFNIEGESSIGADYVTYATLTDMLNDTNRTGVFFPNTFNAGRNIVGSGAFVFRGPISEVVAPGTLALLGLGLAGLAIGRRRRVIQV